MVVPVQEHSRKKTRLLKTEEHDSVPSSPVLLRVPRENSPVIRVGPPKMETLN